MVNLREVNFKCEFRKFHATTKGFTKDLYRDRKGRAGDPDKR